MTIRYQFIKGTNLSWGGSLFLPGNLMKKFFDTANGKREDAGFWSYLMAVVNI